MFVRSDDKTCRPSLTQYLVGLSDDWSFYFCSLTAREKKIFPIPFFFGWPPFFFFLKRRWGSPKSAMTKEPLLTQLASRLRLVKKTCSISQYYRADSGENAPNIPALQLSPALLSLFERSHPNQTNNLGRFDLTFPAPLPPTLSSTYFFFFHRCVVPAQHDHRPPDDWTMLPGPKRASHVALPRDTGSCNRPRPPFFTFHSSFQPHPQLHTMVNNQLPRTKVVYSLLAFSFFFIWFHNKSARK